MPSICVFDAGSTKTALLIHASKETHEYVLPGFNPNRYSDAFEKSLSQITIPAASHIYFYGSGLTSEENKEKVRLILKEIPFEQITIFDDQLGAARAAYGNKEGLIGIMGTGAMAAWYNGQEIDMRRGGHGYLIDDIGGGLELGKVLLSYWLNNDLPAELDQIISDNIPFSKKNFTTKFYQSPDLTMVSGLTKWMVPFQNAPIIHELLADFFEVFFKRHVAPILSIHHTNEMTLIGSIAVGFEPIISEVAEKFKIHSVRTIQSPVQNLMAYHQQNGFKS